MPVPDHQTPIRPVLAALAGGNPTPFPEIRDRIARAVGASEADLAERVSVSGQPVFDSRVRWAVTYLKQAAALDRPSRGLFRITPRGTQLLNLAESVNTRALERFPEFQGFRSRSRTKRTALPGPAATPDSPREQIDASYAELKEAAIAEMLERFCQVSPRRFEESVVELLQGLGYGGAFGEAAAIGRSGDGGVDGVIREDKLGLDFVYVQAKRWESSVSRPPCRRSPAVSRATVPARVFYQHLYLHGRGARLRPAHRKAHRPDRWRGARGADVRVGPRLPYHRNLQAEGPRLRLLRRISRSTRP